MDYAEVFKNITLSKSYKGVANNNPIIEQHYGADPFALVYDDTVYFYMTADAYEYDAKGEIKENSYSQIRSLYVVSTKDMINFTDHGEITIAGAGGATKWAHNSWAPAAAWKMVDGKPKYKLMGQGDMPLKSIFASLAEIGYSGYASLEWVKRWDKGLQNAAIAFPHFANYMSEYRAERQELLQDNKAHTGKYVWPKETLIDCTFPDVLDRMCKEFPDQYAFRYTELDYTRTYIEFRNDVDTFARSLIAMGVRKGDHVAIWATNVPQWYITFWATTKIGAVLVTVNTAYRVHEIEYLLRQSDTHTLVMIEKYKDIDYVEIINELCPELKDSKPGNLNSERLPVLRNVVVAGEKHDGCYTWEEAVALSDTVSQKEVEFRRRFINAHGLAPCGGTEDVLLIIGAVFGEGRGKDAVFAQQTRKP